MKYRKKPIVIEAMQLPREQEPASDELIAWLALADRKITSEKGGCLNIETLEGVMTANPLDWIIKGVAGEFYPCKPNIFEATYEIVTD